MRPWPLGKDKDRSLPDLPEGLPLPACNILINIKKKILSNREEQSLRMATSHSLPASTCISYAFPRIGSGISLS